MKISNRQVITGVVLITVVCSLIIFRAFVSGGVISNVPLPLNSPPGTEYKMPENLPDKSDGPFLTTETIKEIAIDVAKAHGESSPIIKDIVFTTHGALIQEGIFSPSFSVANGREVYLIVMEGNFIFLRVPQGINPVKAPHVNIEIDATTGDALAVGTSLITKDPSILQKLKAN